MTFDSHSLERLKQLGRKLPKEISKPESNELKSQKEAKNQKLHPVEIETNPEQLFRELMEISPDGNVPPHLLERLKKLESKNLRARRPRRARSRRVRRSAAPRALGLGEAPACVQRLHLELIQARFRRRRVL